MSLPLAPWLQAQLDVLTQRRGHAWLLQGPSGLGQYSLAIALARVWLCLAPTAQGACGSCISCRGFETRAHADLFVLMPEVDALEHGWPLDEKAQADIDSKKRKPSKEIRVEAARQMVSFTQLTHSGGGSKAVVIYPAERMNTITANTLLKTLEEPSGNSRFILATQAAQGLPATVRSRCQVHNLRWPSTDEAVGWLQQQGVSAEHAAVWLQIAGGRPEDALKLANQGQDPDTWRQFPKAISQGQLSALAAWSPAQCVEALQKLCHDLWAIRVGGTPRFFLPQDLPQQAPSARALAQWSKQLMQTARSVEHPYNAGLMQEALLSQAQKAMRSS